MMADESAGSKMTSDDQSVNSTPHCPCELLSVLGYQDSIQDGRRPLRVDIGVPPVVQLEPMSINWVAHVFGGNCVNLFFRLHVNVMRSLRHAVTSSDGWNAEVAC